MTLKNLLLLPIFSCVSHAAVIYSESFPNSSDPASNVHTTTVNWVSYLGSTATTTANAASSPRWGISGGAGPDQAIGYLFKDSSNIGVSYEGTAFSLLPANITSITYLAGNSSASLTTSFVVQQNGNWFVSTTSFNTVAQTLANYNSSTASKAELKTLNFDILSTSWNALTIDPDVELSVGAATALDSLAPITRIGIYATGSGVTRIDDITINGVPEPSALLLSALVSLALLRRRAR